jgi:hypothetical protein
MRKRLLHGPLLLFLYQAVPVGVTPDSLDRHRLTVAWATPQVRLAGTDGFIGPGEQYSQQGAAIAVRYAFGAH